MHAVETTFTKFLFWLHACVVIGFVMFCTYANLFICVMVGVAWLWHFWYFGNCLLTILQRKFDGKPENYSFFDECMGEPVSNSEEKMGVNKIDKTTWITQTLVLMCTVIIVCRFFKK